MKTNSKILLYPNEILLKPCDPVSALDFDLNHGTNQWIYNTLELMKEEMLAAPGIGLAAPQIGISKQIFIMKEQKTGDIKEFINPEIISKQGTIYIDEGCLSLP